MSEWVLVSSLCTTRACRLVYRSHDEQIGLQIISGGRKPDRRCYFVWGLPDSATDYGTEAEARTALTAQKETA